MTVYFAAWLDVASSIVPPERVNKHGAAAILGVSPRVVVEMAGRGELPTAAKIGRGWTFDEKALRAYVRKREIETSKNQSRQRLAIGPKAPFTGPRLKALRPSQNTDELWEQIIQRSLKRAKQRIRDDEC